MFAQLFKHAEQRSFLPPIIEHNLACSNKKTNLDKNYIKNSWTLGSPAGHKKTKTKFYSPVYGPTIQKTLRDRSRLANEAGSTSLSDRCNHTAIAIYLTSYGTAI